MSNLPTAPTSSTTGHRTVAHPALANLYNALLGDETVAGVALLRALLDTVYASIASAAMKADPMGWGFPATFDPRATASNISVGTANRTIYTRVIGSGAITKVGLYINASAGSICISHHTPTGTGRAAKPDARVATTGSIACPPVGYAEVSLATTLAQGDFLALGASSTSATFAMTNDSGSNLADGLLWVRTEFPAANPAGVVSPSAGRHPILVGVA